MKHLFALLLMVAMFAFIGCDIPDVKANIVVPEDETVVEEPVVDEPVVETEEPVIEDSIELTVKSYCVNPIPEDVDFYYLTKNSENKNETLYLFYGNDYQSKQMSGHYVYDNESVSGFSFIPRSFFTLNGKIFFSWMIKDEYKDEDELYHSREILYFVQENGVVTQLSTPEGEYWMTAEPDDNYSVFSSDYFKITIEAYAGKPLSQIQNENDNDIYGVRFLQVSGCFENLTGVRPCLFINVTKSGRTDIPTAEGLYLVPKSTQSLSSECVINQKGKLWVL